MRLHRQDPRAPGTRSGRPGEVRAADRGLWPELAGLPEALVRRPFRRGETLTPEGAPWSGLDIIAAGRVILSRGTGDREQVLGLLRRGDVVDVAPLVVRDAPCCFTARAVESGLLYHLAPDEAHSLAAQHPALQLFAAQKMAVQLFRLARLAHDLAFKDVAERLATWLHEEAAALAPGSAGEVVLARDLSLRDLASLLGTAREVVSRSLTRLARDGVIQVERGRIVIVDRARLEALANRG